MADYEDYRWLVSDEGVRQLADARPACGSTLEPLPRLRRLMSPERAALLCEMWDLRARAARKFPAAERMFFTRRALEQATDAAVARYKACRVPADLPRWDLCCGIAGDALALAEAGPVIAIDQDPVLTLLAAANAHALGRAPFTTITGDVVAQVYPREAFLHIDPDRRPAGRRVARRVDEYQPPLEVLRPMVERSAAAACKLAPAATLTENWQNIEREWISRRGECRQQVVWSGRVADHPGQRRATALDDEGNVLGHFAGVPSGTAELAHPGAYIHEPDAALLAAELTDCFADRYGLARLAPHIAYLTADHAVGHPLLSIFRVDEMLPFDRRKLKAALRARKVGRLEIKKRGVDVEPALLVKQLRPDGDERATLLITPSLQGTVALICQRVAHA